METFSGTVVEVTLRAQKLSWGMDNQVSAFGSVLSQ